VLPLSRSDAVFGREAQLAIHVLEGESPAPRTPICELVVDDVDLYIALGVQHGAELCTRLAAADGRATYAQWRDPFGYLWAFAVAS
jgi:uncharacterized glyoxalase superfamily protein PhnB